MFKAFTCLMAFIALTGIALGIYCYTGGTLPLNGYACGRLTAWALAVWIPTWLIRYSWYGRLWLGED